MATSTPVCKSYSNSFPIYCSVLYPYVIDSRTFGAVALSSKTPPPVGQPGNFPLIPINSASLPEAPVAEFIIMLFKIIPLLLIPVVHSNILMSLRFKLFSLFFNYFSMSLNNISLLFKPGSLMKKPVSPAPFRAAHAAAGIALSSPMVFPGSG